MKNEFSSDFSFVFFSVVLVPYLIFENRTHFQNVANVDSAFTVHVCFVVSCRLQWLPISPTSRTYMHHKEIGLWPRLFSFLSDAIILWLPLFASKRLTLTLPKNKIKTINQIDLSIVLLSYYKFLSACTCKRI